MQLLLRALALAIAVAVLLAGGGGATAQGPVKQVKLTEKQVEAFIAAQNDKDLAALIHLCGVSAGDAYAKLHFRLRSGQRCGDHDAAAYLARVNAMKRAFTRLADEERQAPLPARTDPPSYGTRRIPQ